MTLHTLADHLHVAHSTAEGIAKGMSPRIRPANKSGNLSHFDEARLRRALLQVKPVPRPPMMPAAAPMLPFEPEEVPVNEPKIQGVTLALVAEKTGLRESKIKMILSRHAELQSPPFSVKAGGARVFFPPFIEWLAAYEGSEATNHESHKPVTSVTRLPSGAQLHELRLMAEKRLISATQVQRILGVEERVVISIEEPKASPEIGMAAFAEIHARLAREGRMQA